MSKKKFDPFEEERVDSVEAVKAELSPATPCVHADAEGYCTGACEGSICCHCADYKPVTAVATKADAPLFVLEHPAVHNFGSHPNFFDHRVYGSVNFTFFKKNLQ